MIATYWQAEKCDVRNCDDRMPGFYVCMTDLTPDRLRALMREQKKKQVDLANLLGIDPTAVSKIFTGVRTIQHREQPVIQAWLGVAPEPNEGVVARIPIIGQVAAGNWREAVHQSMGSIPSPDAEISPLAFALNVDGDSMDKLVADGGTVIVDPSDKALYPGRYYVVINDTGETTFKQFAADPARLIPCSTNAEHREIVVGDGTAFSIVGRVIWRASRL
ncbi:LexA family protein [Sphingomonas sp. CFBP 13720]|uniref:LexA family protein n=1 Tax=Sphingomonas sp. CFBP 13720 TaxID=2775302 RepID=UPI00177D674B|nr:XRE family transcriptional regulator [Sphingomonas sp. CFBP 13720]MBD8677949.1 hypothetical protein [Sphingomonas sp. CFBP 13720]